MTALEIPAKLLSTAAAIGTIPRRIHQAFSLPAVNLEVPQEEEQPAKPEPRRPARVNAESIRRPRQTWD